MHRRDFLRAFVWGSVASAARAIPGVEAVMTAASASKRAISEKLYSVELGGRMGYVNRLGEIAIAPEYETTYGFNEGLAFFRANGLYGVIDVENRCVTPAMFQSYDMFRPFSEGRCGVQVRGRWGFVDREGRWIVEPTLLELRGFSEGLAACKSESGLWGYVDREGEMVIAPAFSNAYSFHEGLASVQEPNGGYGFIDSTGKWAISPTYQFASDFHQDRAAVTVDIKKEGYIDSSGREVIPARYATTRTFSEGLGLVWTEEAAKAPKDVFYKERASALDLAGREVFVLEPGDYVMPFTSGRLGVGRDLTPEAPRALRKYGFLDHDGKTVIDFRFDEICVFDALGVAHVVESGSRAIIDMEGRVLARVERTDDGKEVLIGAGGKVEWTSNVAQDDGPSSERDL
jgi:hypothetical protein